MRIATGTASPKIGYCSDLAIVNLGAKLGMQLGAFARGAAIRLLSIIGQEAKSQLRSFESSCRDRPILVLTLRRFIRLQSTELKKFATKNILT